jgi:hypothetical protein
VKIWMENTTCQSTLKRSSGSDILGVRSGLHLCKISTCLILMAFWLQDRTYFAGIKTPAGWTSCRCCFIQMLLHHETWLLALHIQHWECNLMPSKLSAIHSFMSIKKDYRLDTTETWSRLWYYMIVHNLTFQVFNASTTHCPDSNCDLWRSSMGSTVWNYPGSM